MDKRPGALVDTGQLCRFRFDADGELGMSDEPKVEGLFREWLRLKSQGAEPSLQDLCADSPQLVDKVRERIRQFEKRTRSEQQDQEPTRWLSATDGEAAVEIDDADGLVLYREGKGENSFESLGVPDSAGGEDGSI